MKRDSGIWLRLMLIAFVANGTGPFGLKVLAERGLAEQYQSQYLVFWYLGGLAFAAVTFFMRHLRVDGRELLLGAAMGLCSLSGQAFSGMALARGIPGHIVFPITTGGTLFLVAAAGILAFRERVGGHGIAGIVLGIAALVVLSVS